MPKDQYVLVTGDPIDGLSFHGPFDDSEEAMKYAETHHGDEMCWVATLLPLMEPAAH